MAAPIRRQPCLIRSFAAQLDDQVLRTALVKPAMIAAALAALSPLVHAAHLREIEAFRLIALGKPFTPPTVPSLSQRVVHARRP